MGASICEYTSPGTGKSCLEQGSAAERGREGERERERQRQRERQREGEELLPLEDNGATDALLLTDLKQDGEQERGRGNWTGYQSDEYSAGCMLGGYRLER